MMNVFCFIKDLLLKSLVTTFLRIDDRNYIRIFKCQSSEFATVQAGTKTIFECQRTSRGQQFKK